MVAEVRSLMRVSWGCTSNAESDDMVMRIVDVIERDAVTVATVRDLFGTSRRTLSLLEHLDGERTRRSGMATSVEAWGAGHHRAHGGVGVPAPQRADYPGSRR